MRRLLFKVLPWKRALRRVASLYGFIDPVEVMSQISAFSRSAEISYPLELLRSGTVFHARGLVNTQAIQHNLDWVWPYWVERQFDPADHSFLPRAFSITHVNLTHRNWTAVGLPDLEELPIVDPAGLITPHYDGWSIEAAIILQNSAVYHISAATNLSQMLLFEDGITVCTTGSKGAKVIETSCRVLLDSETPKVVLSIRAESDERAWLGISIRPYNPEGVSFIRTIRRVGENALLVNEIGELQLDESPHSVRFGNYECGDVYHTKDDRVQDGPGIKCDVGMASAVALYPIEAHQQRQLSARIPLPLSRVGPRPAQWKDILADSATLQIPESSLGFLYNVAVRSLILHSPHDVYPGPFTYKRFWFRDAAFILKALLAVHLPARVRRTLERYASRQRKDGYFHSQDGEWDSNGEALWILEEYLASQGEPLPDEWRLMVESAGDWIKTKRLPIEGSEIHGGLFPAGFSAEHFGPTDYYYWDDFWGVAGLRAAARLLQIKSPEQSAAFHQESESFLKAIEENICRTRTFKQLRTIPASPYRRMDAGAIGTIVGEYPLKLWPELQEMVLTTAEYLFQHCFFRGAFFQDMIHSGLNAYLSLHVGQIFLKVRDFRFLEILRAVANLATPTGQWPEAIHPQTLGGCMGDGQHIWAAAEWVQFIRNMFVDEDEGGLVLLRGIPKEWLSTGAKLLYGPTCTRYGDLTVGVTVDEESIHLTIDPHWHSGVGRSGFGQSGMKMIQPKIIAYVGHGRVELAPGAKEVSFKRV